MAVRPRSRSIKDLLSKIVEQENAVFSGDSSLTPLETPDIGQPSGNTELGAEVLGGAIKGVKDNPDASLGDKAQFAVAGGRDALLKDKDIAAVLELLKR